MTTPAHRRTVGPAFIARAVEVLTDEDYLGVQLEDGRRIQAPLAWFPRLAQASLEQRQNWRLIGRGVGIQWPDIDEDISVENLLGADRDLLMNHAVPRGPDEPSTTEPSPPKKASFSRTA